MVRLLATLVILAFAGTMCAQDEKKPSSPFTSFRGSDAEGPAGNFTLTDRTGETIHARDLRGVIWVAQFFYPGCNECSKTMPTMRRLQEIYRNKPYVRFVSFALKYGDAETLNEFAKDQKAEAGQWLFLADEDESRVHQVIRHSFGTPVIGRVNPSAGDLIGHSSRLILIDANGIMVGQLDASDPSAADTLAVEIEKLRLRQPIPITAGDLPRFNATLNATCTVLLLLGWIAIRLRFVTLHKLIMLLALAVSMAFLASYLFYHFAVMHMEPTRFHGEGAARYVYFGILISHTILAVVVAPMAIYITVQGLRNALPQHVKIARWTLPIWLYVSVTGVVVYWMLYVAEW
jgi:protein SCO1